MGGAFSLDDNDNENDKSQHEEMLNKSVHRGGSNQRRGKNKNTTSKNKPKKSVSFFSDYYGNDDFDNDNDKDNDKDNDNDHRNHDSIDNDLDVMEPIAKKRKPRKQSANTTKKRRYN